MIYQYIVNFFFSSQKTVMTLKDHEAAVWCGVILSEIGLMITGAADGMLKVWKAGTCKSTSKAHSQAIRGMHYDIISALSHTHTSHFQIWW